MLAMYRDRAFAVIGPPILATLAGQPSEPDRKNRCGASGQAVPACAGGGR